MGMTWNDFFLELAQALLPLIAAMLIALIGYGIAFLRKQTAKIDNEVVQQALNGALFEAERVAKDAINATNQKLVDDLKAKASDGKLTKEEAAQAIIAAKRYFVSHISTESLNILNATLGPIEDWLEDFIEAKLGEKKSDIQAEVISIANPLSSNPAS